MNKIHFIIIFCFIFLIYYVYSIKFPIPFDPYIKEREKENIVEFLNKELGIPFKIANSIVKISYMENMDPFLITSLIYTESSFNPRAKSKLGYYGLMQVKPKIDCIETNIFYGIKILKEKISIYNNLETAIIKYKGYDVNSQKGKLEKERLFLFYSNIKEKYKIWRSYEEK